MCDYYIAHTCYLPQVCLNTNYRSITCLKSNYSFNYYIKVPVILSRPSFSSVWKFIKFHFSSLYFLHKHFLCCCSANKNIKHVNTKTFAIGRIIWENCKGADIFGRVCVCVCVCVCIYIYIYAYIYIYIYAYIYIYIYAYIHTCMHTYTQTHTHTQVWAMKLKRHVLDHNNLLAWCRASFLGVMSWEWQIQCIFKPYEILLKTSKMVCQWGK